MLTPGYLAQHYRGQKGGRDPAFIDIAQDHALKIVDDVGVFQLGAVFKGGTAIRNFTPAVKVDFRPTSISRSKILT